MKNCTKRKSYRTLFRASERKDLDKIKSVICCLLTALCLCLTACQTSSITVIDAETREPVADAMGFAYRHEIVAFPRQRLYTTDDKGEITFVYQSGDSFWIGKTGYYPSRFYPGYPGPQPHGFLF